MDREILFSSTVTLHITLPGGVRDTTLGGPTGITNNEFLVNYGVTDALAPFPLHSLINTASATINNNTVTTNMQDVLPIILRLLDPEEMAEYSNYTPTTLDFLANYTDAVDKMQFVIGSTGTGANARPGLYVPGTADTEPSGTAEPEASNGTRTQKFMSYANNVLSYDMNRIAGSSHFHKPRGSWQILQIFAGSVASPREVLLADNDVWVVFQVTEPLLLSPFVFGNKENKQGFYGISNLTFSFNMAANANRAWRCARFGSNQLPTACKTAVVDNFANSTLTFQFLTAHPSLRLSSRNIVPYYELPIYKTVQSAILPARNLTLCSVSNSPQVTSGIMSSNIQLNMIPDKLIIGCRRVISSLDCTYSDNYATISNVNINFNNYAGLLSNMTQQQLWKASVESGLKNLTYDEWIGVVVSAGMGNAAVVSAGEVIRTPYEGLGAFTMAGTAGTIVSRHSAYSHHWFVAGAQLRGGYSTYRGLLGSRLIGAVSFADHAFSLQQRGRFLGTPTCGSCS